MTKRKSQELSFPIFGQNSGEIKQTNDVKLNKTYYNVNPSKNLYKKISLLTEFGYTRLTHRCLVENGEFQIHTSCGIAHTVSRTPRKIPFSQIPL